MQVSIKICCGHLITNKQAKILTNGNEIMNRWQQYFEELLIQNVEQFIDSEETNYENSCTETLKNDMRMM